MILRRWLLFLLLLVLVGACAPSEQPLSADGGAGAIETMIAATIQAMPTNTTYPSRTAKPTQKLSATPSPTDTPIPTLPRLATPTLPQPENILTPGFTNNLYWDYTATPVNFSCIVERTVPEWGEIIKPGYDFRAEWKVRNVGAKHWSAYDFNLVYITGDHMHNPGNKEKPLLFNVYVKDKILLYVQLTAPKEIGLYSAYWGLKSTKKGSEPFCVFSVTIRVNGKK